MPFFPPTQGVCMSSLRMVCACALSPLPPHKVCACMCALFSPLIRAHVFPSPPPYTCAAHASPSSLMRASPGSSLLPQLLPPLLPPLLPLLPQLLPSFPPHITDRRLYPSSDRYYFLVITFFRSLLFLYRSS